MVSKGGPGPMRSPGTCQSVAKILLGNKVSVCRGRDSDMRWSPGHLCSFKKRFCSSQQNRASASLKPLNIFTTSATMILCALKCTSNLSIRFWRLFIILIFWAWRPRRSSFGDTGLTLIDLAPCTCPKAPARGRFLADCSPRFRVKI